MTNKETFTVTRVTTFNDSQRFNEYLCGRGEMYTSSRAKGFLNPDGTIEVAIDKSYYLRGGIKEEQLQAIAEHEKTELTTDEPDCHLAGTIVEYHYILNNFGEEGLRQYHTNLCNLMGGRNDTRNLALKTVLGK